MSEYYDMLRNIKSYKELKELIDDTIKSVEYYKMLNNQEMLNQIKEFLNLLLSLSTYLVGKKRDELVPLGIKKTEEKKKVFSIVANSLDELAPLDATLYSALNLGVMEGDILDIPQMNKWLKDLLSLYKENGYELKLSDFQGLFMSVDADYYQKNKLVSSYMELFFRKKYNLGDEEFIKFTLNNFQNSYISDVSANPMFALMKHATRILYGRHGYIFRKKLDSINERLSSLGYGKIDISSLYETRLFLSEEIDKCEYSLSCAQVGNYVPLLDYYYYSPKAEEKIVHDEKVTKLCQKLLGDNYSKVFFDNKSDLRNDLFYMMDKIVKVELFAELKDEFAKYKKIHGVDDVSERRNALFLEHGKLLEEYRALVSEEVRISGVKPTLIYSNKKKEHDMADVKERKRKKEQEIKEMEKLIGECSLKIAEFLKDFYSDYVVRDKMIGINLLEIEDETRLFGLFSINDSNPDTIALNGLEKFIKYGITLSAVDSDEFRELASMCVECLKDPVLSKKLEDGYKFDSGVNLAYVDKFSKGEFDGLVPDVKRLK